MKAVAALIMAGSLIAWIWVVNEALEIAIHPSPGLTNPTVHVSVRAEMRDMLFAMSLVTAVATYCYALVRWMERRFAAIGPSDTQVVPSDGIRHPPLALLKEAIRRGDVAAVRRLARRATLEAGENSALTPLELADLYGNQEVIEALEAAIRKLAQTSPGTGRRPLALSSPFALTKQNRRGG